MAREELKWQNIDADDLPAQVKKSFDAMVEAEAAFKADLEKLLKAAGPRSFGTRGETDRVGCDSHRDCAAGGKGTVGSGAPLAFCEP
jgi:hypothetical protein